MCWFLKINPFYADNANQISWFLLDNSSKIFHQNKTETDKIYSSTESPGELMEGWLICDHVALLVCVSLIFTGFSVWWVFVCVYFEQSLQKRKKKKKFCFSVSLPNKSFCTAQLHHEGYLESTLLYLGLEQSAALRW